MEESEYKKKYEELETIGNNHQENFQLLLLKQIQTGSFKMAKKMSIFESSDSSQDELLNQVRLLKELSNPHILKYYDVFLEEDDFIVILEFCQEGDIKHYLKKRKQRKEQFSEKLILSWVMQILMGLEYIHGKNIIYRGVSSQNIYMNHQGDMKLGSFGLAKVLENTLQKANTVVGSPCNLSPEIVEGKPYNSKADIWSLGCLIYELATFNHPYEMKNLPQLYERIVKASSPQLPVKYSKYLSPLYKKMLKKNPSYRPSASQLLQEPVFIKLMKEYTKKKKIDALDLRQIVPKQLAIHKKSNISKSPRLVLPPLHPGPSYSNKLQKTEPLGRKTNKSREKIQGSKQKKIEKEKIEIPELPLNRTSPKEKKSPKTPSKSSKQEENVPPEIQKKKRITKPDINEGQYISILYELKLKFLQEKYSPNMSQIFQQTVQFE